MAEDIQQLKLPADLEGAVAAGIGAITVGCPFDLIAKTVVELDVLFFDKVDDQIPGPRISGRRRRLDVDRFEDARIKEIFAASVDLSRQDQVSRFQGQQVSHGAFPGSPRPGYPDI